MYKLGKHPPKLDGRTLRLGKYLRPELSRPPRQVTFYRKVGEAWTMMANDRFHDCTCAAAGHMVNISCRSGKKVLWDAASGTAKT